MKTLSVVVFAVLLFLASLAAESEAYGDVMRPQGKRELGEKVRQH